MERLPDNLQIKICKYLSAADIVNLCEAMPSMISPFKSRTIKGILRRYVRQMEWVDAKLCCMLYSSRLVAESKAESVAESEPEGEELCKAIQCYQGNCHFPSKHIHHDLADRDGTVKFLVFTHSMKALHLHLSFFLTIDDPHFKRRQHLHQNSSVCTGGIESVTRLPYFHMDFNWNSLEGKSALCTKAVEASYLCAFDCVVYMIDSTLHCQVEHSLPLGLRRLIYSITNIAANKTNRPPMLLILDAESKPTANSASRGDHFERLIANLHKLDRITLRGCGGSAANLSPYNWWRVCRLHLRGYKFVNLYEVFRMAALQVARTEAGGSSQGQNALAM
ncbi:hypothetical protein TSMEX_010428 [Taenia solium]|eukprot:TsM_000795500 transcript=TsM_000795500 gene=TsM_000795500